MAKAISEATNQQIIDEYSKGNISQRKLALKLGVSTTHVFRIIKSDRASTPPQRIGDRSTVFS